LEAHIYAMLSVEGTLMYRSSRKRGTGNVGIKKFWQSLNG